MKKPEICHDCTSASAISEFFALALTSRKKSCALAHAHHLTSARSERRSPKLCWLLHAISWIHSYELYSIQSSNIGHGQFSNGQYLNGQWILQDPVTDKLYAFQNSRVNRIKEWNPEKLGWMKIQESNQKIHTPPIQVLRRYFDVECQHSTQGKFLVLI